MTSSPPKSPGVTSAIKSPPRSPTAASAPKSPPKSSSQSPPKPPAAANTTESQPESQPESPIAAAANPEDVTLEADTIDDGDSAMSIPAPFLNSLRSSILEYQEENGRTYHTMSSGKYAYPNDQAEIERLEIQHNVWLLTFRGALAMSPNVHNAKRVLDLRTGSGIWSIDFADTYLDAEVIGVDLSPIQPSLLPPNCSFELNDLEKDWTWTKQFDLIMGRAMAGSFSDYESYIQKAYNALAPGGYLGFQDGTVPFESDDSTLTEDTSTYQLGNLFLEASIAIGRPLDIASTYKDIMIKTGFMDVVERRLKWREIPQCQGQDARRPYRVRD